MRALLLPFPAFEDEDDHAPVVATAAKQRRKEREREIFIVFVCKEGSCVYVYFWQKVNLWEQLSSKNRENS